VICHADANQLERYALRRISLGSIDRTRHLRGFWSLGGQRQRYSGFD
jgi:hypothetical protein